MEKSNLIISALIDWESAVSGMKIIKLFFIFFNTKLGEVMANSDFFNLQVHSSNTWPNITNSWKWANSYSFEFGGKESEYW